MRSGNALASRKIELREFALAAGFLDSCGIAPAVSHRIKTVVLTIEQDRRPLVSRAAFEQRRSRCLTCHIQTVVFGHLVSRRERPTRHLERSPGRGPLAAQPPRLNFWRRIVADGIDDLCGAGLADGFNDQDMFEAKDAKTSTEPETHI